MKSINKYVCQIIYITDNNKFYKKIINILKKQDIYLVYIDNTSNNINIINNFNFKFGYKSYLYFFNFNISNIFNYNDICLLV